MNEAERERPKKTMTRNWSLLGIVLLIGIVLVFSFPDKKGEVIAISLEFFIEMIMILPAVMVLMGFFTVWVSKEMTMKYLGKSSGIKGILLAIFLGSMPTGPLYVAFPVAAELRKKGASISNIIILLSAWSCIKIPQEMVELQFLGLNFMVSRLLLTVIFIIIMGLLIERIIEYDNKKE